MARFDVAQKAVVVAACSYEVAAILTRRVPTITALDKRYPVIGATIVTALAWHFAAGTD